MLSPTPSLLLLLLLHASTCHAAELFDISSAVSAASSKAVAQLATAILGTAVMPTLLPQVTDNATIDFSTANSTNSTDTSVSIPATVYIPFIGILLIVLGSFCIAVVVYYRAEQSYKSLQAQNDEGTKRREKIAKAIKASARKEEALRRRKAMSSSSSSEDTNDSSSSSSGTDTDTPSSSSSSPASKSPSGSGSATPSSSSSSAGDDSDGSIGTAMSSRVAGDKMTERQSVRRDRR